MFIAASVATAAAATAAAPLAYRAVRKHRRAVEARIDGVHGIAESRYVTIGGVDQWLQIRGEDRANPVLLVVHGGPGSPYSVFTALLREWERHFTVVHWDRRGCGRTLRRNGWPPAGELTFERMVEDGIEVAEWLRRHLDKDKIVLMAGSMGTIVGLPMAQRRPDLFSAYVGTDFYVDMVANEREGRRDTLARLRAAGNKRGVAALEALDDDPRGWDVAAWGRRMQWSMATDPTTPNAVFKLLFPLLLTKPDYSLGDVMAWLQGFGKVRDAMFEQFMAFDARSLGTRFEIPFHLFQGARDVVTLTEPAVDYFAEVEAPHKSLVLIEDASHFAAFTQPGRFLAALRGATA
ncbi:alpha/beta fold hydrolase [Dactylosporangium sucinum]|uniref:prolyl aminopeptidase n=1 Tax=Dactylosporangium sucinum TaxID=1424081 RepID=A0A917T8N5_9ACTN|nr:alpha/beta hydrolase [Dactylosporangium sucinum]GGM13384.1 proline iminopeptidase [Dactylosporangium sucinum]